MKKLFAFLMILLAGALPSGAANSESAATATNQFGVDLYRKIAVSGGNLCLSPYSLSSALAMTLAGADGKTRAEMAQVLHVSSADDAGAAFAALQHSLGESAARSVKTAAAEKGTAMQLSVANRLFTQKGFALRPQFLAQVKENFDAAPEPLDFRQSPSGATETINNWIAQQTHNRIQQLIGQPLPAATRLVLANALYFKASWATPFPHDTTKPEPFHLGGTAPVNVPMMQREGSLAYAKRDGYTAIALPYLGGEFQFVILLPDAPDGLPQLEAKLSGALLADCARMSPSKILLHLPKFELKPPTLDLNQPLQALGMTTAFDIPPGSANFDRMAPRSPNDYLAISDVFHKTFITLDEDGTEAAAATAVVMRLTTALAPPEEPIEVRVDHPFLYAIQHVPSGVCIFLGRVTDPR